MNSGINDLQYDKRIKYIRALQARNASTEISSCADTPTATSPRSS